MPYQASKEGGRSGHDHQLACGTADWWAKAQDRGRRRAARSLVSCTAQSRKLEWKPCGTTATHASEQPVQPFAF